MSRSRCATVPCLSACGGLHDASLELFLAYAARGLRRGLRRRTHELFRRRLLRLCVACDGVHRRHHRRSPCALGHRCDHSRWSRTLAASSRDWKGKPLRRTARCVIAAGDPRVHAEAVKMLKGCEQNSPSLKGRMNSVKQTSPTNVVELPPEPRPDGIVFHQDLVLGVFEFDVIAIRQARGERAAWRASGRSGRGRRRRTSTGVVAMASA